MEAILVNTLADLPIYALLTLSFHITYRLLNFPDLALDAAFALGMALAASFAATASLFALTLSIVATPFAAAVLTSAVAGLYFYNRLHVGKLLAGLLVSYVFYAINFRVNGYTSTASLSTRAHELNRLREVAGADYSMALVVATTTVVVLSVYVLVHLILESHVGLILKVVGHRPALAVESGFRPRAWVFGGFCLAQSLSVTAGVLRAGSDNYSDINTFGTFLVPLAGLLLGRAALTRWVPSLGDTVLAPLIGAFMISFVIQASIFALVRWVRHPISADTRLAVAVAVLLGFAISRGHVSRGSELERD